MKTAAIWLLALLLVPGAARAEWVRLPIRVRRPAEISLPPEVKRIAVLPFPGGRSKWLGAMVRTELSACLSADSRGRFEFPAEKLVDNWLALHGSGLDTSFAELGEGLGVDAVVVGRLDDSSGVEQQADFTDVIKYRAMTGEQYVEHCPTVVRSGHLGITFEIVDAVSGLALVHTHRTYDSLSRKVTDPNPRDRYVKPGTNAIVAALVPDPFAGDLLPSEMIQQNLVHQATLEFCRSTLSHDDVLMVAWNDEVAPRRVLAMLRAGQYSKALAMMDQVIPVQEHDSKNPKDQRHLGFLYYDYGVTFELDGRLDDAQAWYEKALVLTDGGLEAQDGIRRVAMQRSERAVLEEPPR
jgi:hypothetical protein